MAAAPPGYKPSPLGQHGSTTRNSPFRRPESPASPSPLRQTTPLLSPARITAAPLQSGGSWLGNNNHGSNNNISSAPTTTGSRTPRGNDSAGAGGGGDEIQTTSPKAVRPGAKRSTTSTSIGNNNAMSQLPPSQVRMLREGFQILDRDSDGTVGREDVADMLSQLGLPANASDVSKFFPPSTPQTITLATFLSSLSNVLAALSPSMELLSAFSAFDDDDSGQVNLAELRDALLHTAPEPGERAPTEDEVDRIMSGFTGRRAFSKSSGNHHGARGGPGGMMGTKRGEVFRYQEFVQSIVGGNNGAEAAASDDS